MSVERRFDDSLCVRLRDESGRQGDTPLGRLLFEASLRVESLEAEVAMEHGLNAAKLAREQAMQAELNRWRDMSLERGARSVNAGNKLAFRVDSSGRTS